MHQLEISRAFDVSRQRLYQAWSDAAVMQKWFCPGEMTVPEASADCRVDGSYKIVMQQKDGVQHIVSGQYQQVVPDEKLVFTWKWQNSPHTSLVTVVFKDRSPSGSELHLTHTEFVDSDTRDEHRKGWHGCLDRLVNKQTEL